MNIAKVTTTFISTNTYIIYDGETAVVIDPGGDYKKIAKKLTDLNVSCKGILLTHGHFDHINAAAQLQCDGAKVYIHSLDEHMCLKEFSEALGSRIRVNTFKPDVLLSDGDAVIIGGLEFKVLHTPGHTAGSVCYTIGDALFSGDTLFCGDVGRTDLPTGNERDLQHSIKNKLFILDFNYTVNPGHGNNSTLFAERDTNPYVAR